MTSPPDLANKDLADEISAINAIYEPDTITVTSSNEPTNTLDLGSTSKTAGLDITIRLQIPTHAALSFIIGFEPTYPDTPPRVLSTASTSSRGEGEIAVSVAEDILARTYQPGAVCLFDLINEAVEAIGELNIGEAGGDVASHPTEDKAAVPREEDVTAEDIASLSLRDTFGLDGPPEWILSDVVTEKKSVFLGRAASVTSLEQAQGCLDHLLATDKKAAVATHNISAWRIRQRTGGRGDNEAIIQDCDDDGEAAAGGRLLHLMQLMDVWDVVVVASRWYGGIKLGPDRFRLINAVGKDALIKGGFSKESTTTNGAGKGKKKGKK